MARIGSILPTVRDSGVKIEFEAVGEVCVVRLEGRFATGSDAEYLRAREMLSKSPYRSVIVDCAKVPYLDSTALNFLVGLYTSVVNRGGRLVLCGLNARMSEVLRITHLDQIIPVYADRQAALEVLTKAQAAPD